MCDPSLISSSPLRLHAATGPGTQVQATCMRRSAKCRYLADQLPSLRHDEGHLPFQASDRKAYQVKLEAFCVIELASPPTFRVRIRIVGGDDSAEYDGGKHKVAFCISGVATVLQRRRTAAPCMITSDTTLRSLCLCPASAVVAER